MLEGFNINRTLRIVCFKLELVGTVKLYFTRNSSTFLGCWVLHSHAIEMASCQIGCFQILEEKNLTFLKGFVFDSAVVNSSHG